MRIQYNIYYEACTNFQGISLNKLEGFSITRLSQQLSTTRNFVDCVKWQEHHTMSTVTTTQIPALVVHTTEVLRVGANKRIPQEAIPCFTGEGVGHPKSHPIIRDMDSRYLFPHTIPATY